MSVSEVAFRKLALEEPDARWELHCGEPRQKPSMTAAHNHIMTRLFGFLIRQLDERDFDVRSNAGHVSRSPEHYYIPDLFVVPMELVRPLLPQQDVLESYAGPLPLVVEIWSCSTGDYDIDTKLLEYRRRGDLEIWRIHPYERTLIAWRRQRDGTYVKSTFTGGIISPIALPGVSIDLDALFQ